MKMTGIERVFVILPKEKVITIGRHDVKNDQPGAKPETFKRNLFVEIEIPT